MRVNGTAERWLLAARLSRMSRRDRERGDDVINGIQTQDKRGAEWARDHGHEIVHVTKDRNVSGAIPPWERPELGPWLTDPELVIRYDGIVAYEVSRLSRDYADLTWLRKWAEQNNKKLYVIKDGLRWPDNRDGIRWAVEAERAYQDRQDIIEKVSRELGALKNAGKLVGRPPFGYDCAGEKYDRHLIPNDDGRKYIPEIFRRVIDGHSQAQIVAWLRAEGVSPVSGKWWPRTIGAIIKNPVYIGRRCEREIIPPDEIEIVVSVLNGPDKVERQPYTDKADKGRIVGWRYGDKWVDYPRDRYGKTVHQCEPLLVTPDGKPDAATWRRANAALSGRPKRGHSGPENRAMLAGALSCPDCDDSPMYLRKAGRAGQYRYYYCMGRGSQRQSCGNLVTVAAVDDAVNAIIAGAFNVPVMVKKIDHGNEAALEAELAGIEFELKQLPARGLSRADEQAERERLWAEQDKVSATVLVPDTVREVPSKDTYAGLWARLGIHERGGWLRGHGFQVTASKDAVTVRKGDYSRAITFR
jgi:site-specific DNA recombinase